MTFFLEIIQRHNFNVRESRKEIRKLIRGICRDSGLAISGLCSLLWKWNKNREWRTKSSRGREVEAEFGHNNNRTMSHP